VRQDLLIEEQQKEKQRQQQEQEAECARASHATHAFFFRACAQLFDGQWT
jgi:hypothetical protein